MLEPLLEWIAPHVMIAATAVGAREEYLEERSEGRNGGSDDGKTVFSGCPDK